jgi:hypothetical protein
MRGEVERRERVLERALAVAVAASTVGASSNNNNSAAALTRRDAHIHNPCSITALYSSHNTSTRHSRAHGSPPFFL